MTRLNHFQIQYIFYLMLFFSCKPLINNKQKIIEIQFCNSILIKSLNDTFRGNENLNDTLLINIVNVINNSTCKFRKDTLLLTLASKLYNLGNNFYFENSEKSRLCYQAALKLRNDYYGDSIHIDKLKAIINVGGTYEIEENYVYALRSYDSADVRENRFDLIPYIYIQIRKGVCYKNLRNYTKAQESLQFALDRYTKYKDCSISRDSIAWVKSQKYFYDLITEFSEVYLKQKQRNNALQIAYQGVKMYRKLGIIIDSNMQLGKLFFNIGNILRDSAVACNNKSIQWTLWENAIAYYGQAIKYYSLINKKELILACMINIGLIYSYRKEFIKELKAINEGIRIAKSVNNINLKPEYITLFNNLGFNFYNRGLLYESLLKYKMALWQIDSFNVKKNQLPTISNFYKISNGLSIALLQSLGRVTYKLANSNNILFGASACYDSLYQFVNHIRGNLIDDKAKINFAEEFIKLIPDAIHDIRTIYYTSNNAVYKEQTFQLVEQAKAFSLLETSRINNATELLPKELVSLQNEVAQLQLIGAANDSIKDIAERKHREFLSELKVKAPSYFALKYKGVDLSVKQIQQELLGPDQAMIEYFIHDSLLNVFLITKSEFILDTVHITKQKLSGLINSFQNNMNPVGADGSVSQEKAKAFCFSTFSLYEALLGKLKKTNKLPNRLIIIPDGMLSNVSFDALLAKISGSGDDIPLQVKNENFMVQQHAISYCFSANLLYEMNKQRNRQELQNTLALFAPDFHPESKTLPFMHYQDEEIKGIQACIANSKTDKENTKARFIKATGKYAYLHISTHGFVSEDPDKSFLAFSQKSSTADTSQLFYLKELYNYKMNQELITLTACETALGQQREGEGNISLARGFAYAGVRSFITTIWKIQTNGASKIMPGFYDRLFNKRLPKDVALAESKREFLKLGKSVYPENWAGLILIGNTENKFEPYSSINILWYVMAVLISLLFFRWIYNKNIHKGT